MARDDKNKTPSIPRSIMSKLWSLRKQMDGVYRDTYSTEPTSRDELERIGSDIEDHISKVLARNGNSNIADISRLYAVANLRTAVGNADYNRSIINYFEDSAVTDSLINSYMENKWVIELDREIDVVLKYMPKLQEALDAIKDSVLTADNFDKENITFNSPSVGPTEMASFNEELESIKRTYDLYDRVEKWYDNTSKYGEQFVYKVPYNKALATLMNRRPSTRYTGFSSSATGVRESVILENGQIPSQYKSQDWFDNSFLSAQDAVNDSGLRNIKLEIVKDSVLQSAVDESTQLRKMISIAEQTSIMEAKVDRILPDETFEVPNEIVGKGGSKDSTSQEGIIGNNDQYTEKSFKVPGMLIRELKHENIIMLYLDDICLGYYYIEFVDKFGSSVYQDNLFQRKSLSSVGYSAGVKFEDEQRTTSATDELLKYLSSAIVSNLDDKFINNNPKLRREIYAVLKYNDVFNAAGIDRIRVTYLSPNDVEHITFREDPDTHRGISDIAASLIPAKLWCCLYICNTIGILTRGQDKRVYYVKQNVEQNIAQTLLNVINQIKKQNMNIMQIENMNSILGITGKYNDYIIPVGPSGDAPIQFEIMQGQEIDPQTELMDKLEETAINATGIPIELVTARLSVDFATQLTMSNSKFLRFILKRQARFERHIGNIVTDIFNTERENDVNKTTIQCILPAPLMLNINNLNQILDLLNNQADLISQFEYPDNNEEDVDTKRAIFKREYVHYKMGNYLKLNEINTIKARSELKYHKQQKPQGQE